MVSAHVTEAMLYLRRILNVQRVKNKKVPISKLM